MKNSLSAHLPQLTWLRGIAALLVLFSHVNRANEISYSGESYQEFWLLNLLDLGSFGVALFFTLSGCTLYLSNHNKGFAKCQNWFSFYLKRFFRIWPAFAVALLTYIIAGEVFYNSLKPYEGSWIAEQFIKNYELNDVLNYILLIFNYTGPEGLFNNAFWSLPVEFQYYLILPILILMLKQWGPISIFLFILASHLLYKANFGSFDSNLFFRLAFTFCFGVLIGYIYKKTSLRIPNWFAILSLSMVTIFIALFANGSFSGISMPSEWIVYGLAAAICVVVSVISRVAVPRYIAKFLNFYGDISYSLYLFHNLIIAIAVLLFIQISIFLSPFKLLFLTVSTLIGATAVAWCSYKLVEQPGITLGCKVSLLLDKNSSKNS